MGTRRTTVIAVLLFALVTACSATSSAADTASAKSEARVAQATAARTGGPCSGAPAPSRWQHVVVVMMENHGYNQVVGHSPYLDTLIKQCALATDYHGITYPSLPNYLAVTGGSTFGVRDDRSPSVHKIGSPSIFGQVSSRSLMESMQGTCSSAGTQLYAVKHNPQAYYTHEQAHCRQTDVALRLPPDLSAAYTFISPNLCHDTHNCPVISGDAYLGKLVPALLHTPQYRAGRTAVVITWDTDDRSQGNRIPTVVVAPSVRPGTRDGHAYNHYSLLRTTEQMLGLPLLANATHASSMRSGMHL